MTHILSLFAFLGCSPDENQPMHDAINGDESTFDSKSHQSPNRVGISVSSSKDTQTDVEDVKAIPIPKPAEIRLGQTPYDVPLPSWMTDLPVPSDNLLTHAGVALGRFLFYEPLMSGNNTQSCGSCHQQRLSFTDGQRLSVGSEGRLAKRNAMALVNLAWTAPYFWDGRMPSLEALIPVPITDPDELNQDMDVLIEELKAHPQYPQRFELAFPGEGITKDTIVKSIAQFLRTLVSFNSRADLLNAGLVALTPLEERGNALMVAGFPKGDSNAVVDLCDKCHLHSAGVKGEEQEMGLFTDSSFKNNGLSSSDVDSGRMQVTGFKKDKGLFMVPTIRNLTVTAPYMHDGRMETIEDVISHYSDQVQESPQLTEPLLFNGKAIRMNLNEEDKSAVVAMMKIFTDESFLVNPAFSNPND